MAKVTVLNQKTRIVASGRGQDRALRDAIRGHCRVQLPLLCGDFFDAADDFLFAGGSKGQFTEDSAYLKAMRELRTKRNLFEEAFIDITVTMLFAGSYAQGQRDAGDTRHLLDRHSEMYEMLEIDLALQAMQRKADKVYLEQQQLLDSVLTLVPLTNASGAPLKFALVNASLWAFGEAQRIFSLPLELRLVVIKLFEQQFLLKLEKLYQDVIAMAKKAHAGPGDELLVAGPVSAASHRHDSQHTQISGSAPGRESVGNSSGTIDNAVDAVISNYRSIPNLPAFVADMMRCKWRTVLFLIGVNRGCNGADWKEAIDAMQQLANCTSGQCAISSAELDNLLQKLCKGFSLLQMPRLEQEAFVKQVHESLGRLAINNAPEQVVAHKKPADGIKPEAQLSPSGKKVLNREDLDEIASLIGGESAADSRSAMEKELIDCLPEIDQLASDVVVQYKIDGSFQACSLAKNPSRPGMFTITDRQSKTTINRSRLGLAISLHEGELRLPRSAMVGGSSQKTVIDSRVTPDQLN